MAAKYKLRRFAEMKDFSHVIEPPLNSVFDKQSAALKRHPLAGNWAQEFGNNHPIVIELGCGKGEYTVGMAERFPDKNFIGVDIKGARMWVGARNAIEQKCENVRFLRTRIDFIDAFFAQKEVSEIWITFPDPQAEKPRKRLTSPLFIRRYKNILSNTGAVHLKTDSDLMFEYTCEEIAREGYTLKACHRHLYSELPHILPLTLREVLSIPTYYEQLFSAKGHTIHYVQFEL
jgi:tRNA (guanine-N7-)-methyltransferase